MPQPVKIHFHLAQDDDDYPPVSVESVWATPREAPQQFVLDNVPFFVREATLGDTVIASAGEGGYWFDKVVRRSDNSLIRVVFFDEAQRERIMRDLECLGCSTELLKAHALIAVNVPPQASLAAVQKYLQQEATAQNLDYEEPILRQ
jgi:hypothetical protein